MSILKGSRYEGVKVTALVRDDGTVVRLLNNRRPLEIDDLRGRVFVKELQRGEDLDKISYDVVRRERLWWVIAELNDVEFAWDLDPGTELAIPEREIFQLFD